MQKSPDGSFSLIGPPIRFDGKRPPFSRNAPELGEANQEVFAFMKDG
jgi:crotonobetainyl-CoA:carnitine CoA-transferase CaiB-like acyl-CoA transferase